jgi:hypothetical protein
MGSSAAIMTIRWSNFVFETNVHKLQTGSKSAPDFLCRPVNRDRS